MTADQLEKLLDQLNDSHELVVSDADAAGQCDELYVIWREAQDEANAAYANWRRKANDETYYVYLAAEDRASAAAVTFATQAS